MDATVDGTDVQSPIGGVREVLDYLGWECFAKWGAGRDHCQRPSAAECLESWAAIFGQLDFTPFRECPCECHRF